jgi:hypothetical protein
MSSLKMQWPDSGFNETDYGFRNADWGITAEEEWNIGMME